MTYTLDDCKWLIKADEPYKGTTESILCPDGTVMYTGERKEVRTKLPNGVLDIAITFKQLTLAEYEAEKGYKFKVLSGAELDALDEEFNDKLKSKPKRITEARYWEMLEVLPPCRWHSIGSFEVFHVSEGLRADLVSWFAHGNNKWYEFTESKFIKDEALLKLLTS